MHIDGFHVTFTLFGTTTLSRYVSGFSLVLGFPCFIYLVFEIVSPHIFFPWGYTKMGYSGLRKKLFNLGFQMGGKRIVVFCFLSHIEFLFLFGFGYTTFVFWLSLPCVLADVHGWQSCIGWENSATFPCHLVCILHLRVFLDREQKEKRPASIVGWSWKIWRAGQSIYP